MSESWREIIAESDFPEDGKHAEVVNGWHVFLVRLDDGYQALNDRCTHAASRLSTGRIRRGAVMCPLHGARFKLADGSCIGGAYPDLRSFEVKVEDGAIHCLIPDEKPGIEELPVQTA
jgi:nitrite reductase/ring-hydroxylating ferredoxin subunit